MPETSTGQKHQRRRQKAARPSRKDKPDTKAKPSGKNGIQQSGKEKAAAPLQTDAFHTLISGLHFLTRLEVHQRSKLYTTLSYPDNSLPAAKLFLEATELFGGNIPPHEGDWGKKSWLGNGGAMITAGKLFEEVAEDKGLADIKVKAVKGKLILTGKRQFTTELDEGYYDIPINNIYSIKDKQLRKCFVIMLHLFLKMNVSIWEEMMDGGRWHEYITNGTQEFEEGSEDWKEHQAYIDNVLADYRKDGKACMFYEEIESIKCSVSSFKANINKLSRFKRRHVNCARLLMKAYEIFRQNMKMKDIIGVNVYELENHSSGTTPITWWDKFFFIWEHSDSDMSRLVQEDLDERWGESGEVNPYVKFTVENGKITQEEPKLIHKLLPEFFNMILKRPWT